MDDKTINSEPGDAFLSTDLLAAIERHLVMSKEITQQISLPRYPAGGTVGRAAVTQIMRHLAGAESELNGLKVQLSDHKQCMAANA